MNATASPFLRLPPEVRCRIYDYLFGSNTIHIIGVDVFDRWGSWDAERETQYSLGHCQSPRDHRAVPRRFVEHTDILSIHEQDVRGCTIHRGESTAVTARNLGLDLLLVSRQIYHEAVLKPFSESVFHHETQRYRHYCLLRHFLNALVPAQARAIANLRIVLRCNYDDRNVVEHQADPGKSSIEKLTGLQDVEIVMAPTFIIEPNARRLKSDLTQKLLLPTGLSNLVSNRVKSMRFTMEVEYPNHESELSGGYPIFATKQETEEIEAWAEKIEVGLQFGTMVMRGARPLPRDHRVVQNDNMRGVPPPSAIRQEAAALDPSERTARLEAWIREINREA